LDQSKIVDTLSKLPNQPASTARILKLLDDPNSSAKDLGKIMDIDPAMSEQVLRLANSPVFGVGGGAVTIKRAVVMLGFDTIKALALSSAAAVFVRPDPVIATSFWPHAVAAGATASRVAARIGREGPDAFTAGLLHDIGHAVCHLLGEDARSEHAEAGSLALEHWHFPSDLVRAVASHHDTPSAVLEPMVLVVQTAAGVAAKVGRRLNEDEPDPELTLDLLGIGRDWLPQLSSAVVRDLRSLAGRMAN
jgi:putative nucleotidyltransferase with HDIG domain